MYRVTMRRTAAACAAALVFATTAHATDHGALATLVSPSVVRVIDTARGYSGSGVFVAGGTILTALHTMSDPNKIDVQLADGRLVPAVGIDHDRPNDLALITVSITGPAIEISTEQSHVGEEVLSFGFPLGGSLAVTAGHLAATKYNLGRHREMLLVDASTNPGSSGGPLVNMRGKVIGMSANTVLGMNNMGMSVPASRIIPFLKRNGIGGTQ